MQTFPAVLAADNPHPRQAVGPQLLPEFLPSSETIKECRRQIIAVASGRPPEDYSLSRSHEPDLAKALKQQKEGRSECRQIVALNSIE